MFTIIFCRISIQKINGGGSRVRTNDLLCAKQMLYQLSYAPDNTNAELSLYPTIELVCLESC